MIIRSARIDDCFELGKTLRNIEVKEVFISGGLSAFEAVYDSFKNSSQSFTAQDDNKVISMFGISPLTPLGNTAAAFMLTSDNIYGVNRFTFAKKVKEITNLLRQNWTLVNICLAQHSENTRFMKFLGARIDYDFCEIKGYKYHRVVFNQLS